VNSERLIGCPVREKVDSNKNEGVQMKNKSKSYRYTRLFKQEVVGEIKKENLTVLGASAYYGVPFQTIYKWLRKENIPNPRMEVIYVSLNDKNAAIKKNEQMKKEIAELKSAVSDLTLKNLYLEKIVELSKKEYDIDLKKNFATSQRKK
jgi:transposase-like protein